MVKRFEYWSNLAPNNHTRLTIFFVEIWWNSKGRPIEAWHLQTCRIFWSCPKAFSIVLFSHPHPVFIHPFNGPAKWTDAVCSKTWLNAGGRCHIWHRATGGLLGLLGRNPWRMGMPHCTCHRAHGSFHFPWHLSCQKVLIDLLTNLSYKVCSRVPLTEASMSVRLTMTWNPGPTFCSLNLWISFEKGIILIMLAHHEITSVFCEKHDELQKGLS